jgi:hypothetical protein
VDLSRTEHHFYTTQGALTSLPPHTFSAVPGDPRELRAMVSGLVVHADLCGLYEFTPSEAELAEMHIRPLPEMLAVLRGKSDRPLTEARPAPARLLGSCRAFAVLLAALLRANGTPSRVRAGFASYFAPGVWDDHWITEYFVDGRWLRADAQLDDVVTAAFRVTIDPDDLPADAFRSGSEAWLGYRAGELDPALYGFLDVRGPRNIAGAVLRDLAALTKHEMLPWDYWGRTDDWDLGRSQPDPEEIDEIARTVAGGDLAGIRAIVRRPGFAVPADLGLVRADR